MKQTGPKCPVPKCQGMDAKRSGPKSPGAKHPCSKSSAAKHPGLSRHGVKYRPGAKCDP